MTNSRQLRCPEWSVDESNWCGSVTDINWHTFIYQRPYTLRHNSSAISREVRRQRLGDKKQTVIMTALLNEIRNKQGEKRNHAGGRLLVIINCSRCNTRNLLPVRFSPELNPRTPIWHQGKSRVRQFNPKAKQEWLPWGKTSPAEV